MRRTGVIVAAAILATGSLGGCAVDRDVVEGSRSPTPTVTSPAASPTSSPSPTEPPTPPTPSVPAFEKGAAGREAFARYVLDAWGHALNTNDPGPLLSTGAGKGRCAGCAELSAELDERRYDWYVDFPGVEVTAIDVAPGPAAGTFTAKASVNIPETTSYFYNGTFRNTNAAHPDARFRVDFRVEGQRYVLTGFRVS